MTTETETPTPITVESLCNCPTYDALLAHVNELLPQFDYMDSRRNYLDGIRLGMTHLKAYATVVTTVVDPMPLPEPTPVEPVEDEEES